MAIVLPQGRLNNSSDLPIRNFIFDKARLLAVVGLNVNTFKPHTGTKTSVLFLQKYTDDEVSEISDTIAKHSTEWDEYWAGELLPIADIGVIAEDDLPDILKTEIEIAFNDDVSSDDESDNEDGADEPVDKEALQTFIAELGAKLTANARFKGRADVVRLYDEKRKQFASLDYSAQVKWVLSDVKSVENIRKNWLQKRSAEELDYPIFFAVSQKSGKGNNGDPEYIMDEDTGKPKLDEHGHRIIDHDCDEIADAFIEFAKSEGFDFWES
jgi:type I restriction enzyme M protein